MSATPPPSFAPGELPPDSSPAALPATSSHAPIETLPVAVLDNSTSLIEATSRPERPLLLEQLETDDDTMPSTNHRGLNKDEQKSIEFVLKAAQERQVKFVQLWFTDILGLLKSVAIITEELEGALEEGIAFDGSAIEGFARQDESDMIALPDPHTFTLLPFTGADGGVARMFCNIMEPGGIPTASDPRYILRRQLKVAADLGYTFYVGPEVEFFYFKQPPEGAPLRPEPLDRGNYFDLTPMDVATPLRRKTALTLEKMEIGVESSHHEGAPSQHEIDLRYTDALTMADSLMTFRLVVKEIAAENGCYATFMPKPTAAHNGSGMHINMSLFRGGKNAFFDKKNPDQMSDVARKYIAGLLRHARELTLFTNQWVNSYKRLVPGFEAPTRVTWAMRNRADLIRVPSLKPGRESSRRIEYRSPDAACNPYLVFALLLAAGLEGIQNNYELPAEMDDNASILPADLNEAISAALESELARRVLGDVLFDKFIANKRMEWENYRSQVHEYELDRYLGIL
ncbi:MAG TPA: type I glutamate--ammonia ligase [Abditibacterium sp.]|jgi:glutamine synthetase